MKRLALRYLNFKKSLTTLSFALAFSGCIGGTAKKEVPLPQWYLQAPNNTAQFLYGEGEGSSMEEAKQNALNNMASRLVVSVSSTIDSSTRSTTTDNGSSYSKDVSKNVKVEVQKIKFTNATVKNSEMANGKFYTLMEVNRPLLFAQKKGEFDSKDARVEERYSTLNGKAKLDQIHILQDIYPLLKEAKTQTIVLNAINNGFPYAIYTKKYDEYMDRLDAIKRECVINVKTNTDEKYFADNLVDLLNQNKFKISDTMAKSDIIIDIKTSPKYSVTSGWNIAKVSTTLSVISDGKVVSNKIIATVGRSSTSQESALEDASKKFRSEIEKQTLDSVIFAK